MDQAGADCTAGVADAEHAGQLPGVVVPVPHVDLVPSQVLGDLAWQGPSGPEVGGRPTAGRGAGTGGAGEPRPPRAHTRAKSPARGARPRPPGPPPRAPRARARP